MWESVVPLPSPLFLPFPLPPPSRFLALIFHLDKYHKSGIFLKKSYKLCLGLCSVITRKPYLPPLIFTLALVSMKPYPCSQQSLSSFIKWGVKSCPPPSQEVTDTWRRGGSIIDFPDAVIRETLAFFSPRESFPNVRCLGKKKLFLLVPP